MAGFKVTGVIKGMKSVQKKIDGLHAEVLSAQTEAVAVSTLLIHGEAVKLIQQNSGGHPEIRYGAKGKSGSSSKRVVMVSNPGSPPNTDTGRLVQSIKFDFQKQGLVGRVGSNLKYAAWLEFGTKIMEARPWLSTAIENTSRQVAEIFRKAVAKKLNKKGGTE